MRHGLLLGMAIAAALSLPAMATGLSGNPDSIIIANASIDPVGRQVSVPVHFVTHGDAVYYNLPLVVQPAGVLTFQSMVPSEALQGWDDNWQGRNSDGSQAILMGFADLGGENNLPLNTQGNRAEAFILTFTINENPTSESAQIMARIDERAGAAVFGYNDGLTGKNPVVSGGNINLAPTSADDATQLPTEVSLNQNYPNPFNPTTEIAFALPDGRNVRLTVYNVLGQEVRSLVNGAYEAGFHKIVWDGRNNEGNEVPSGAYFYRLNAGDFTQSMKMVLLK